MTLPWNKARKEELSCEPSKSESQKKKHMFKEITQHRSTLIIAHGKWGKTLTTSSDLDFWFQQRSGSANTVNEHLREWTVSWKRFDRWKWLKTTNMLSLKSCRLSKCSTVSLTTLREKTELMIDAWLFNKQTLKEWKNTSNTRVWSYLTTKATMMTSVVEYVELQQLINKLTSIELINYFDSRFITLSNVLKKKKVNIFCFFLEFWTIQHIWVRFPPFLTFFKPNNTYLSRKL